MTNHTPTLETCQKLKAAGFDQRCEHNYFRRRHGDELFVADTDEFAGLDQVPDIECAAPLLTEILEQLPKRIEDDLYLEAEFNRDAVFGYVRTEWEGSEFALATHHKNPAEAAALLYLELKERK